MYIADLHIHSRYSRATSKDCTPEYLDLWARRKGIHILGTGDFTHPAWRQELEEKLVPAEEGFYRLKEELRLKDAAPVGAKIPRFVISGEISSIYKKNGRVRKVHNVILLPGLEEANRLARKLETIGNIHSDGRPILGLDSRDLLEITLDICPRAIFVPAHIWTPHFSMFGAFSGFDTIEECFEDMTPYVHAFETGLSSDPPMNWRLSALDHLQMISNSDAHSPGKLGREANLLDIEMCYQGLYEAIQEGKGLKGTIEFFPEEGKYHYDGHRKCNLCLSPREAEKYQGKCPVCGKKLTLGVSHRIQQLADREEGFVRPGAAAFESLAPLPEVIASATGRSAASAKVQRQYEELLGSLGTEFEILREIPAGDIEKKAGYFIAEGIRRLRQRKVRRFPGFDGEYGTIQLFEPSELDSMDGQMSMFAMMGATGNLFGEMAAEAIGVEVSDVGIEDTGISTSDMVIEKASGAGTTNVGASDAGTANVGAGATGATDVEADRAKKTNVGARVGETVAVGMCVDRKSDVEVSVVKAASVETSNLKVANYQASDVKISSAGTTVADMTIARTNDVKTADGSNMNVNRATSESHVASDTLNQEQLQAVRSVAPRIAVIAGPGTGKTKTLVSRVLYLMQNRRVKQSEITAVTFTNKAAEEMRTRLEQQLGGKRGTRNLRIGTFHSICYDLLKEAGEEFTLADEETVLEVVREAAEETGIKGKPGKLRQIISQRKTDVSVWDESSEQRENRDSGNLSEQKHVAVDTDVNTSTSTNTSTDIDRLAACYQRRLEALSALDFDDLLLKVLEKAKENSWSFPYLLIDEFQDISPLQYKLIQAWGEKSREIFVIGDPDQAIYGFRGADTDSFRRFCGEKETEVIRLRKNYRSTPEILTASKEVLKGEDEPLEAVKPSGAKVRLVQIPGEMAEAIFAAKEVNRLVGGIDMLDAQEKFSESDERKTRSFSDIGILYRTHKQAQLIETCLRREGIPYVVAGREEFLEEPIVRGSLAFFRSILNSEDCLSRKVCLKLLWNLEENCLSQSVYDTMAEKYRKLCKKGKPEQVWKSWRRDMESGEALFLEKSKNMKKSGFLEKSESMKKQKSAEKEKSVEKEKSAEKQKSTEKEKSVEKQKSMEKLESIEKLESMAVFYKSMEEMLKALAFGRESDLKRCGGKTYTADAVTLMTMHGSKGLEFPVVLLHGARKGLVPLEYKGREADMDEERRLLYVAMTRAKEELIITGSREPSVFLKEIPETVLIREQTKSKNDFQDSGRQMSLFDFEGFGKAVR